ncbi:hypothetical protein IG195_09000 [Arthrobacter sp. TES]|uniref:hypothetical protein n=1 Tax=Paenarthrobacter ureafaciens TaxID=37931 RepID=UPI000396F2DF|nr:hypothetical protein [Paenarthrobacter ureafaciens]AOY73627.1 hypothetical protein ARZXY2_4127 [Arthrobacter sp. ZXY-2]QOI65146.1 hypothetical protein IG195_09000 [Arthrobacter sp. TES]GLU60573.1 hypothetical protein Pure01_30860 [Paenarthrobacter ureafaciens]GLU64698.1 hypothetical protein Pure02_29480 [Paenarthrobacter ureafaciens]GLU68978.1 hypothetical protein Pure03_29540 [Paenarthrobacter ureafaciens]
MRKLSKKSRITAAVAGVALVAVGGGAAYAYWTTTGSGNGTATNSAGGGTITLFATFDGGLAPGNQVDVAYTATNSMTSSTKVGELTPTVSTDKAGCLPGWFTATAETSNTLVAAGATSSVGAGTLTFNDSATENQDACKGAVVTVSVTSK